MFMFAECSMLVLGFGNCYNPTSNDSLSARILNGNRLVVVLCSDELADIK